MSTIWTPATATNNLRCILSAKSCDKRVSLGKGKLRQAVDLEHGSTQHRLYIVSLMFVLYQSGDKYEHMTYIIYRIKLLKGP